ncbi:hypothetical protein ACFZBZ_26335 [Streptomyces sp. NPDC008196]
MTTLRATTTRPVHMFGLPVPYLFRPYAVHRGRDPGQSGSRPDS